MLTAAAALLTGCGQAYDTDYYGSSVAIEPSHNFFGLVKTSPGSFIPVDETTIHLPTSQISAARDFSGNNVSLFWGALTITDY